VAATALCEKDKIAKRVRKRWPAFEGTPMSESRKADSRVRKTELALHRSLASLIHEKSYDEIVVQEILARANVARSTFYAHFDGKEELLIGSIRHVLGVARAAQPAPADPVERLLGFSLPLLQHIEAHMERSSAGVQDTGHEQVHQRLTQVLCEVVEADIRRAQLDRAVCDVPAGLLARHLAATFLVVLEWWLPQRQSHDAGAANQFYRALAEPALRR
jgi:AcrR family transcriptional regulator